MTRTFIFRAAFAVSLTATVASPALSAAQTSAGDAATTQPDRYTSAPGTQPVEGNGVIEGKVLDSSGQPVAKANVMLSSVQMTPPQLTTTADGKSALQSSGGTSSLTNKAVSGEDGSFRIEKVPPAQYRPMAMVQRRIFMYEPPGWEPGKMAQLPRDWDQVSVKITGEEKIQGLRVVEQPPRESPGGVYIDTPGSPRPSTD